MSRILIICGLLMNFGFTNAQFIPAKNYNFHPPLDIPLVLAANFGELRSNHFHTGLDFKTNRRIGYNLYSIAEGWVSRVKVSPWGYGKVVYVDHPNGLTSVYAHCSEFKGQLAEVVKAIQQKEQNYAIEYFPKKNEIPLKKGEVFALSGNSGSSTAPHLHFEIRETATEHALNPLLLQFDVADNTKPTVRAVKVYALTERGYRIPNKAKTYSVNSSAGKLSLASNQITVPSTFCSKTGGIGFAFDAIDQLDGASNVCGIFTSELKVDGETVFSQDMTEIHFESNRQINTHKDYEDYHNKRKQYQKSFKTIHNSLPIYRTENSGILNFTPGSTHQIEYTCSDTKGNSRAVKFELVIENGPLGNVETTFGDNSEFLYPDSAFMDIDEEHLVLMSPGLVYEPTPIIITKKQPFVFGDSEIPLQEYYKIMLKVGDSLSHPKEKYLVLKTNNSGRSTSLGGTIKDGWITTRSRDFGEFSVRTDLIPPTVTPQNVRDNQNVRGRTLVWKIGDNMSGIADYDIFIDGKWYLLEYEPKQRSAIFKTSKALNGKHTLKIVVKDKCNNATELSYNLLF